MTRGRVNVQCSSSASFTGAIARGRDQEEDEEEERKKRFAKKGRRVSLAHGRRPTCTTSKTTAKWGGGKGIKKKELGKDFKLVYNDVEMRTIID